MSLSVGPFVLWLAFIVLAAVGAVVALNYFLRPRTRGRYPGGARRYLLAIVMQATGFIAPIPIVVIALFGVVPAGLDVIIAFLVSLAVLMALRAAPLADPLLRDLSRARLEVALESQAPYTKPTETQP